MLYVPNHLVWLDRAERQADGWPVGISEETKAFAVSRVTSLLDRGKPVTLDEAQRAIFEPSHAIPADIRSPLWDFLYAVTHRALLAAKARQVWVGEGGGACESKA